MKISQKILCAVFLLPLIVGCAEHKYQNAFQAKREPIEAPTSVSTTSQGLPWEIWSLGKTSTGTPIINSTLLQGDEYARRGDQKNALALYAKVNPAKLSSEEKEALTLRLVSSELAQGMPQRALATMSKYFRSLGKSEKEVPPIFSLLFGYAYGAQGDIDQSLAWFERAALSDSTAASLYKQSEQGVRLLLRTLPDERLQEVTDTWSADDFVRALAGRERAQRMHPGSRVAAVTKSPFWEATLSADEPGLSAEAAMAGNIGTFEFGALLPLSGQYAALGKSLKNGIELAVEMAKPANPELKVSADFKDDAGDTLNAVMMGKELISNGKQLVFGPLLTEAAKEVATLLRRSGRSLITFAKSSDLNTGDGVFRLGVTVESQVKSILEVCQERYGYIRYAVVYPGTAAGEEFAGTFKELLSSYSFQPVFERSYPPNDFNAFNQIIEELTAVNPQAVFLPDNLEAAARFFSALPESLKHGVLRPIGTAAWDNSLQLKQSRVALDGAIFPTPFFVESSRESVKSFIAAYEGRYGKRPDFLAAQGFDAATLALAAFRQWSPGISLADAISQTGVYEGLTGRISVQPGGEMERKLTALILEDGKLTELNGSNASVKPPEQPQQ